MPNEQTNPIRIFIAYSEEDKPYLDGLIGHLTLLEKSGEIALFYDGLIVSGKERDETIKENLHSSDIILLLVSADFVKTDYCYNVETTIALEKHEQGSAQVIPIILRPLVFEDARFAKLNFLPNKATPVGSYPGGMDKAYTEIVTRLKENIAKERLKDKKAAENLRDSLLTAITPQDIQNIIQKEVTRILEEKLPKPYICYFTNVRIRHKASGLYLACGERFRQMNDYPHKQSDPFTTGNLYGNIILTYDKDVNSLWIIQDPWGFDSEHKGNSRNKWEYRIGRTVKNEEALRVLNIGKHLCLHSHNRDYFQLTSEGNFDVCGFVTALGDPNEEDNWRFIRLSSEGNNDALKSGEIIQITHVYTSKNGTRYLTADPKLGENDRVYTQINARDPNTEWVIEVQ